MIGGKTFSCCSNVTINHSQWPARYDRIKANETLWCFSEQHSAVFLRLLFSPTRFCFSAEFSERRTPALNSIVKNDILQAIDFIYLMEIYRALIKLYLEILRERNGFLSVNK